MQQVLTINHQRWAYGFIFIHVLCWTFVPFLVRYNLPLDAIEGTIWGHQLEWGYDKNPFLNGWLTALAIFIGGGSGWLIYAFSQLSVAACMWVVWQLGKEMLTPTIAVIAVMLLEGMQYFNLHAIDFNDNTLELGLWALTIYCFYQALHTTKKTAWIFTGIFAALAMMAKYYTSVLLTAMLLLFLLRREYRTQLKTSGPYLCILTFSAIISPHIVWLVSHDFITIQYVFGRASNVPHWSNHFFYPAQFAWQQLEVLLPTLVLFCLLFVGKLSRSFHDLAMTRNNKIFLLSIGLGPLLLTLMLSFVFGITLRAGWGMPLLSLFTLLLLAYIPPQVTPAKCYRFFTAIYLLLMLLLTGYSFSLIYSKTPTSANFPGQEIADVITQHWQNTYPGKLAYVAGSRWVGGNIGFYSKDHPAVFIEWNQKRAPWVAIEDMKAKGAVFIWDISANEILPEEVSKKFPQLTPTIMLKFNWKRNNHHLEPIKIGVAFLPPESIGSRGIAQRVNLRG